MHPYLSSLGSILILFSHLRLGLPCGLYFSGLPTKSLHAPLFSPVLLRIKVKNYCVYNFFFVLMWVTSSKHCRHTCINRKLNNVLVYIGGAKVTWQSMFNMLPIVLSDLRHAVCVCVCVCMVTDCEVPSQVDWGIQTHISVVSAEFIPSLLVLWYALHRPKTVHIGGEPRKWCFLCVSVYIRVLRPFGHTTNISSEMLLAASGKMADNVQVNIEVL